MFSCIETIAPSNSHARIVNDCTIEIMEIPKGYSCDNCKSLHSAADFPRLSWIRRVNRFSTCIFCQFIFSVIESNSPTRNQILNDFAFKIYIGPSSLTLGCFPEGGSSFRLLGLHADFGK